MKGIETPNYQNAPNHVQFAVPACNARPAAGSRGQPAHANNRSN